VGLGLVRIQASVRHSTRAKLEKCKGAGSNDRMTGHSSAGRSHCQNCGEPLSGPFCSNCGQHDIDYHRSLGPIIEDSLEGLLHFDGKFFRSVRWLFTRPGFLTKEFIAGKRVAYIHPLRLYIFASFLYFASQLLLPHNATQAEIAQARADTAEDQKQKTEAADATKAPAKASMFTTVMERIKNEHHEELTKEFDHLVPTTVFFCLPFLAAALLLAYAKSGRVYVEHLIFALHVQAFYFLAKLASDIVQALIRLVSVPLADLAQVLLFLFGAWLVYRAFRTVYGEGRWRTIFKVAAVGLAYGFVLVVAMALTAITASLLLLTGSSVPVTGAH
jgi:hypothetical protein